ncbi:MAG TPA: methyl-accepting chemotaxis protein [Burkholderiales bacterium]|nr:methyl-accepting chemotaxis protein [Burkholderiales bacterium]
MRISTKLALGFLVLLALMVTMAGIGFWRLGDMAQRVHRIISDDAKEERVVWEWFSETKSNAVRAIVLTRTDDEEIKKLLAPTLEATTKRISELQKQVESLLSTDEAKAIFAEVGEKRQAYIAARTAAVEARKAGNRDEANRLVDTRMVPAIDAYVATLNKMVAYQKRALESSGEIVLSNAESGRMIYVFCAVMILSVGLAIMWWLRRSIMRPLNDAVQVAQTVAAGDLTRVIGVNTRDEAGQLMSALQEMNESLARIVRDARQATDTIANASQELATSNSHLSARTEQQAASLEQTSSSVAQFTVTVKQNAENARRAATLAANASGVAQKGGQMVSDVVTTMNEISESSTKIADIIGVIDGIAFQTNILALNAAVEAARAGEQGRGFAVVAAEVRNLAQRSATAAKEIKSLISDSANKVQGGARVVGDTGKTMQEVVEAVRQVNDIISQIAAASQDQSAGVEQVNQAISHMDQSTQQNAALVEEAAATAEHMAAEAERLAAVVSRFKVRAATEFGHHAKPGTERRVPTNAEAPFTQGVKPNQNRARPNKLLGAQEASSAPRLPSKDGEDGNWKEF